MAVEAELAKVRMLLEAITSGSLRMRLNGIDVTDRELFLLNLEIAAMERRLRGGEPGSTLGRKDPIFQTMLLRPASRRR
jgi:hypothetical protein